MGVPVSPLAVGALLSGGVAVAFLRFLWPYRDSPGARFFLATIACEALWAFAYGVALFVFDPVLRRWFELPIWAGINFIGVFFLAFALEYTGRGDLARSKWLYGLAGLQGLHTLIVATNPLHHVAWSGYRIDPVLGAATVSYAHQPWLFVNAAGLMLMLAAASFLLFDTFFSYGPLYRTQAAAIALSPVLPGIAGLLWLLDVGATPPVNFVPLTFPIHLGFDLYAFFRRDMFELTPAARRAGERAAIDDLGSPVFIVDGDGRLIDLNGEAERVLDADSDAVLGRPLSALLDGIDPAGEGQSASIVADGERREYAVTTSAIDDAAGRRVGHTIVLQDVTAERRREQRLAVLNRVLRHNLRNDLNVVLGSVDYGRERASDEGVRDALATAKTKTEEVIDLGEKARLIERAMGGDHEPRPVALRDLLADLAGELAGDHGGSVEIDVPEWLRIRADSRLLEGVFGNLVENALEHDDAEAPTATVALVDLPDDGGRATFEIRDNGPGIPDHELAPLDSGEETALEHGSGLGLWFVKWGVDSLGGEVDFESDDSGTTVILTLPNVVADGAPAGREGS